MSLKHKTSFFFCPIKVFIFTQFSILLFFLTDHFLFSFFNGRSSLFCETKLNFFLHYVFFLYQVAFCRRLHLYEYCLNTLFFSLSKYFNHFYVHFLSLFTTIYGFFFLVLRILFEYNFSFLYQNTLTIVFIFFCLSSLPFLVPFFFSFFDCCYYLFLLLLFCCVLFSFLMNLTFFHTLHVSCFCH